MAYCFPEFNFSWLIWISLVPLLEVIYNSTPKKAFFYGWIYGIFSMGTVAYWLTILPGGYFAWGTYCIFYAIYPAFMCLILSWINLNFPQKHFIPFMSPFIWVSMEWIRSMGIMGFTWTDLGYSQHDFTSLIQVASITGVQGITFIIVAVNEFLREILSFKPSFRFSAKHFRDKGDLLSFSLTVIFFFIIYMGYGVYTERTFKYKIERGHRTGIAILQPAIEQEIKWDPPHWGEIITKYFNMTKEAGEKEPYIILWPETAIPGFILQNPPLMEAVGGLAKETGAYLLVGALDKGTKESILNTAILFTPDGKFSQKYHKMHLVPFGEFLPARKVFEKIPGLKELVKPISRFSHGKERVIFETEDIKFVVAICFESIFPEISRKGMEKGAECIVVITNDAWFKRTAAPYQHNVISVFRAIENRTFVVRCANTGISSVIDPLGRIMEDTELYEDTVIYGDIYPHRGTFYTLYGNLFSLLCLFCIITVIIYTGLKKGKKKKTMEELS